MSLFDVMLNLIQHLTFWSNLVRSRIKSGMTKLFFKNLFWTRMIGVTDIDQLAFAAGKGRSFFSYNRRHFAKIHYDWMKLKKSHAGMILSDQLTIGVVLRRLMRLYFSLNSDEMRNRLEYLGAWK